MHLNTECAQTDGRKEKTSHDILPVHSVHLADIIIQYVQNADIKYDEMTLLQTLKKCSCALVIYYQRYLVDFCVPRLQHAIPKIVIHCHHQLVLRSVWNRLPLIGHRQQVSRFHPHAVPRYQFWQYVCVITIDTFYIHNHTQPALPHLFKYYTTVWRWLCNWVYHKPNLLIGGKRLPWLYLLTFHMLTLCVLVWLTRVCWSFFINQLAARWLKDVTIRYRTQLIGCRNTAGSPNSLSPAVMNVCDVYNHKQSKWKLFHLTYLHWFTLCVTLLRTLTSV